MQDASSPGWFNYLTEWQQQLVNTSFRLSEKEKNKTEFEDYSFIVFPMAKAYEGFLKKYLLELNLISKEVYESKRFRIGRSLNPDVNEKQRDNWWLFDDLARICGADLARELWEAWLTCRNRVFHFFPKEKGKLSFSEAESRLNQMIQAMSRAVLCINKN